MENKKRRKVPKGKKGQVGVEFKSLVDVFKNRKKIEIKDLKAYSLILVKTTNSSYKIALIDPKTSVCVVHGTNEFFSKPVRCRIEGSVPSFGSSTLYSGVILEGFCIEIVVYSLSKRIWLSNIQRTQVQEGSKLAKQMITDSCKNTH